jgi:hypothetical protein
MDLKQKFSSEFESFNSKNISKFSIFNNGDDSSVFSCNATDTHEDFQSLKSTFANTQTLFLTQSSSNTSNQSQQQQQKEENQQEKHQENKSNIQPVSLKRPYPSIVLNTSSNEYDLISTNNSNDFDDSSTYLFDSQTSSFESSFNNSTSNDQKIHKSTNLNSKLSKHFLADAKAENHKNNIFNRTKLSFNSSKLPIFLIFW